jgi:hypothetical protein
MVAISIAMTGESFAEKLKKGQVPFTGKLKIIKYIAAQIYGPAVRTSRRIRITEAMNHITEVDEIAIKARFRPLK